MRQRRTARCLDTARAALTRGDHTGARDAIAELVLLAPDNPEVVNLRAALPADDALATLAGEHTGVDTVSLPAATVPIDLGSPRASLSVADDTNLLLDLDASEADGIESFPAESSAVAHPTAEPPDEVVILPQVPASGRAEWRFAMGLGAATVAVAVLLILAGRWQQPVASAVTAQSEPSVATTIAAPTTAEVQPPAQTVPTSGDAASLDTLEVDEHAATSDGAGASGNPAPVDGNDGTVTPEPTQQRSSLEHSSAVTGPRESAGRETSRDGNRDATPAGPVAAAGSGGAPTTPATTPRPTAARPTELERRETAPDTSEGFARSSVARLTPDAPRVNGSRENPTAQREPAEAPAAATPLPSAVLTSFTRTDAAPPTVVPDVPVRREAAVPAPPAEAPPVNTPAMSGTVVASPARTRPAAPAPSEAAVRAVLDQYVAAYNTLDASAARAVWPGVNQTALQRAFAQLESQTLRFEQCNVSIASSGGSATCSGQAAWVPRIGDRDPRRERRTWRFELAQNGGEWIITRAEARR